MITIINNQKKERDILLSRPYLTRHTKYDVDELLASKQIKLVRRGYHTETSLFYYRSRNDKETDFVTRQGTHVESLIQVCYDLSSERTLKREVDSVIECAGELKCSNLIIVTMREERVIEKNGYKVRVLPIYKF